MEIERRIIKVGDSTGFIIPPDLLKHMEINIDDMIIIKDDEGKHGKFVAFWKKER